MKIQTHRRLLQLAIAIGAIVPVMAGTLGIVTGKDMVGVMPDNINLDSHVRYLSGILFAMGLAFWSFIPRITQRIAEIKVLTFVIFIGGLARAYAALFVAVPSLPMVLAIGMELVVTPALCVWAIYIRKHSSLSIPSS